MKRGWLAAFTWCLAACVASHAQATMRITEWLYSGNDGEFIEFTNVGAAPIDMTGWSFDDDSRLPGTVSLSGFGVVAPGASVILTENPDIVFRASWSLPASVAVLGLNTTNLGRTDEINLFDGASQLADRLTYSDQNIPGSIRTQNISGNPKTLGALGVNDVKQWQLSTVGDAYGSYAAAGGDVANPGKFSLYVAIPEPTGALLMLVGVGCAARRRK